MQNTGDQDETMEVGFPAFRSTDFTKFTVSVDGEKVTPRDATVSDQSADGFERKQRWKVWQSTFVAGRTQRVEVRYQHSLAERLHPDEGVFLNNAERFQTVPVNYILVTGRDWHGPIGKCRIEMTFDGWKQENALNWGLYSAHCKVKSGRVIWDIRDFEPKYDLGVGLMPNATRKDLRQALEQAMRKSNEGEVAIQTFVSSLDRTDGRPQDGIQRDCELVRAWQNRVAFWGPDSKDSQRLTDLFRIWTTVQQLTNECDRLGDQKTAREIAPAVRNMAQRLRTQAEAEPAESPSVKYRLPQIDEVLK